mmetsp:Transcript_30192/g.62174  ORF Transcript_30192/g.62174 Transcript_30192/m.62174 type:complete len:87 (-) Transcript_30192:67-327(-)
MITSLAEQAGIASGRGGFTARNAIAPITEMPIRVQQGTKRDLSINIRDRCTSSPSNSIEDLSLANGPITDSSHCAATDCADNAFWL